MLVRGWFSLPMTGVELRTKRVSHYRQFVLPVVSRGSVRFLATLLHELDNLFVGR